MSKNIPFFVQSLPILFLGICSTHLVAKSLMLKHQLPSVSENATNTHFGLTCVTTAFLCILTSLIIVDILFKTHFTFRYVVFMNIAVVACGLFVTGYLLGHIVEIWFAKMSTIYSCRQLGIQTYLITSNSTGEEVRKLESAGCETAISSEFKNVFFDLLIQAVFIPLHILLTAFSWTFSGLYRPRWHEDFE
ncbi:Serpentine Receptor, class J [Caenorhabditis elegans]|uniref:Serpentine Receptor, class J n=1 Tax=Caenorhabditis elegans TaxID=6239 RepID=Q19710_CAEEL|nr:Serpentine Receptor, class J [Caenorhabditis elegans]CAA90358.2 Serpentine Receptor, class J [Caenorhabditis elegans]|eukprot:NP_495783.2 Uncharacterized protein CELE_F22B5.6 [Caenorhabditis elegans]